MHFAVHFQHIFPSFGTSRKKAHKIANLTLFNPLATMAEDNNDSSVALPPRRVVSLAIRGHGKKTHSHVCRDPGPAQNIKYTGITDGSGTLNPFGGWELPYRKKGFDEQTHVRKGYWLDMWNKDGCPGGVGTPEENALGANLHTAASATVNGPEPVHGSATGLGKIIPAPSATPAALVPAAAVAAAAAGGLDAGAMVIPGGHGGGGGPVHIGRSPVAGTAAPSAPALAPALTAAAAAAATHGNAGGANDIGGNTGFVQLDHGAARPDPEPLTSMAGAAGAVGTAGGLNSGATNLAMPDGHGGGGGGPVHIGRSTVAGTAAPPALDPALTAAAAAATRGNAGAIHAGRLIAGGTNASITTGPVQFNPEPEAQAAGDAAGQWSEENGGPGLFADEDGAPAAAAATAARSNQRRAVANPNAYRGGLAGGDGGGRIGIGIGRGLPSGAPTFPPATKHPCPASAAASSRIGLDGRLAGVASEAVGMGIGTGGGGGDAGGAALVMQPFGAPPGAPYANLGIGGTRGRATANGGNGINGDGGIGFGVGAAASLKSPSRSHGLLSFQMETHDGNILTVYEHGGAYFTCFPGSNTIEVLDLAPCRQSGTHYLFYNDAAIGTVPPAIVAQATRIGQYDSDDLSRFSGNSRRSGTGRKDDRQYADYYASVESPVRSRGQHLHHGDDHSRYSAGGGHPGGIGLPKDDRDPYHGGGNGRRYADEDAPIESPVRSRKLFRDAGVACGGGGGGGGIGPNVKYSNDIYELDGDDNGGCLKSPGRKKVASNHPGHRHFFHTPNRHHLTSRSHVTPNIITDHSTPLARAPPAEHPKTEPSVANAMLKFVAEQRRCNDNYEKWRKEKDERDAKTNSDIAALQDGKKEQDEQNAKTNDAIDQLEDLKADFSQFKVKQTEKVNKLERFAAHVTKRQDESDALQTETLATVRENSEGIKNLKMAEK